MNLKITLFIFLVSATFCSCKNDLKKANNNHDADAISVDSTFLKNPEEKHKHQLRSQINFKSFLSNQNDITHTGNQFSDEFSNSSSNFTSDIFGLEENQLSVETTSYTYKGDCRFYVHDIKCVDDTLSIKPFLESAQGSTTRGYLGERALIFAMKNDKEANYIDIPEKLNPFELRRELFEVFRYKINGDVIICNRTKSCVYEDLRNAKSD